MNSHFPDGGTLHIRPASFNDIPFIQHIAYETWPVAYGQILPEAQLKYMLDLFYNPAALHQQITEQHHFFIALSKFTPVGFAAFSQIGTGIFKLQKLYVLPHVQKSGAGVALLKTIEDTARSMEGTKLALNVNRMNSALSFYIKQGYTIAGEEDIDIGSGYYMNDYLLEKAL